MLREHLFHLIMLVTKKTVLLCLTFLTIPLEDSYYQTQGSMDTIKTY